MASKLNKRSIGPVIGIIVIVLINVVLSGKFFRVDLTEEKRYTLAPVTKSFLSNLETDVFIRVYLDGELNPGFRKLARSSRETLEEFRIISRGRIKYEFIDPTDNSEIIEELKELGVSPVPVFEVTADGRRIQSNVYPFAHFRVGEYEMVVNLLENVPGLNATANLNLSMEGLEYKISSSIRNMLTDEVQSVAFLEGHGELEEIDVYDISEELSHYYQVDRGSLTSDPYILDAYKVLIIAKPREKFSERDKFILDQYVMRGGKVLWLVDAVHITLDSLKGASQTPGVASELGIEDLLFRYGVRINMELLQDVQSSLIPVNVAPQGEQARMVPMPWMFNPLMSTNTSHPVTRGVNLVKGEFVSSIDTVGTFGLMRRDILLQTGQYSRRLPVPVYVSIAMVNEQPNREEFNQSYIPTAVAMEGVFPSLFANRPVPPGVDIDLSDIKRESVATRMIVVADGDVIRNDVRMRYSASPQIVPLGYDEVSSQNFGNKDFILNAVHYLADDEGWMSLRTRDYRIRLLDREKLAHDLDFWKWLNLAVPPLFLLLIGAGFIIWRRYKYR